MNDLLMGTTGLPTGIIDTDMSLINSERKAELIYGIIEEMSGMLNQRQMTELNRVLIRALKSVDIIDQEKYVTEDSLENNERLIEAFINSKRLEGRTEKTLTFYKDCIVKMVRTVDKPIQKIRTEDLRKFLANYGKNVSPVSVDNFRRNLNSFFVWLVEEEYIIHSPMAKIHKIKAPKIVKKPFEQQDIEKIRNACADIRDRAIIEFLLSSGVRVGELVGLNRDEIDFNNNSCVVFGKGQKEREVYFSESSKYYLKKYLDTRHDDEKALFVNEKKPHNRLGTMGVETLVRNIGLRAGVEKTHPHRFRRTMATNAINNGMPIEQVRILLGHVNLDTTTMYAIVDQKSVQASHRKYIK